MKKFTEKFGVIGWLLLISVIALGAGVGTNAFRIGDKTGSDIEILMGNGRLKWDNALSKLLFSNDGGASEKEIGAGGGSGSGVNILENADFETGSPPDNWTASAGNYIAAADGFDTQAGSWDAAATAQTLDSDLQAVPLGLENRFCNATIQYKYLAGSSGDYKIQVVANTAGLLGEKDLALTTKWEKSAVPFECPASDSIRIRIISTTDGGVILVDNASLGKSDFTDVSQTELVAEAFYPQTTSCTWSIASASFVDYGAVAACPAISVVASTQAVNTADNDLPDIVFDELKPGIYTVSANFISGYSSAASHVKQYRISDGTSNGIVCMNSGSTTDFDSLECKMTVVITTAQAKTFIMQAQESAAGFANIINDISSLAGELNWRIVRYPLNSAEAINLETIGEHWDVNIGGANPSLGTSNITSYTEITDAGLDLVINTSKGSKSAQIPCSTTNPSTGLTCSAGSESIGIVIDVSTAGRYRVCGEFTHQMTADISGVVEAAFQWIETPNNSQTILQEGDSRITSGADLGTGSAETGSLPHHLCGSFNFSSAGQKTLRIMYELTAAATISLNVISANRNVSIGQRDIHITVEKLDQQMPTPVFTDLTNSLNRKIDGNVDNLRTVTASINNPAGTFTITQQDGTWIDSITDVGVGQSTLNITTGIFSGAPNCTCTTLSVNRFCAFTSAHTNIGAFVRTIGDTGNFQESSYYITCTGPK